MFPFDQSSLPQLTSRRALVVVDLQREFTTADGRLPVTEPPGYIDRTIELARQFRQTGGEVAWVRTNVDTRRPDDQVITSATSDDDDDPSADIQNGPDEEAFLSHEVPTCLQNGSAGCEWEAAVESAKQTTDFSITKSTYSAFASGALVRGLRAKMVMEVFICGSLANIGVYATAIDAAGHGFTITIVEDCCGYRDEGRQRRAVKSLVELIGCDIASSKEVLDTINPQAPSASSKAPKSSSKSDKGKPKSRGHGRVREQASESPGLTRPMSDLRLAVGSPVPEVIDAEDSRGPTSAPAGGEAESQPSKPREAGKSPPSSITRHDFDSQGALEIDENFNKLSQTEGKGKETHHQVSPDTSSHPEPSRLREVKRSETPEANPGEEEGSPRKARKMMSEREPSTVEVENDKALVTGSDELDPSSSTQRGLCEGDTDVIENLLSVDLETGIIDKLHSEIKWQTMSHQGGEVPRLVAVQGEVASDGSIPIYRHPSDESPPLLPFSPTVLDIKSATEKQLGHPLNHVLIQFYRDGKDYISEHSDKTLDIAKGSYIANVSLGAERTMVLRTKRWDKDPSRQSEDGTPADTKRKIQRARLPHNSLFRMGLQTNMKWLHSIRQDKRADRDKSPAELAFSGGRISLTFRQIGTFLNQDGDMIWGQGATGKTTEEAKPVINGQTPEAISMIKAFGAENHSSTFDWEARYGGGFDVLHMSNAPRFFSSGDHIIDGIVVAMLEAFNVPYAKGSLGLSPKAPGSGEPVDVRVKFIDDDENRSEVRGSMAVMLYLDARYGSKEPEVDLATKFSMFLRAMEMAHKRRCLLDREQLSEGMLDAELATWDKIVKGTATEFLAGSKASLPDFVLRSVLQSMVSLEGGDAVLDAYDSLKTHYRKKLSVAGTAEKGEPKEEEEQQQSSGASQSPKVEK